MSFNVAVQLLVSLVACLSSLKDWCTKGIVARFYQVMNTSEMTSITRIINNYVYANSKLHGLVASTALG